MCCEGLPKQVTTVQNTELDNHTAIDDNPQQVNYLIDEAVETGKGGNTVVSMLHHFLATHGLGERCVHLHADNCVGQNKNNFVMQVLHIGTIIFKLT